MSGLVHRLLFQQAAHRPEQEAIRFAGEGSAYAELAQNVERAASAFVRMGLKRHDRVAVCLPKSPEAVAALFGAAAAGGVFVPVNPVLKPFQIAHIIRDAGARFLVTTAERWPALGGAVERAPTLKGIIQVGERLAEASLESVLWRDFVASGDGGPTHRSIDADLAALIYTSGSVGPPKGVALSHRNLTCGAASVAEYLGNRPGDRLLALLPLSFDYGLSQLTTAFQCGGCAVLMNYFAPQEVVQTVIRERITGMAGVPSLWIQLAGAAWPEAAGVSLRYITNSGGAMPLPVVTTLREKLPRTSIYLMYGFTEAFRSTFLSPDQLARRPESIGKAIPNAEILVLRDDGTPCAPGEPGELVHRGSLVARGYWNAPERTAERFRPLPTALDGAPEIAAWSGDLVKSDEEGFLYFIGRKDDLIKTVGFRVSPTEVEEVIYAAGVKGEVVAFGVPEPLLGHAIIVALRPAAPEEDAVSLLKICRRALPRHMVPAQVWLVDELPYNQNGKPDRRALRALFLQASVVPEGGARAPAG